MFTNCGINKSNYLSLQKECVCILTIRYQITKKTIMTETENLFSRITTFIFDYDGVMTDGSVYISPEGLDLRTSNVKDGYALQLAIKLGYNVAVISGALCNTITPRLQRLGLCDIFVGVPDKVVKLNEYMRDKSLKPEQVLYMGDDIPDYRTMLMVGLPTAPADAVPEIKNISRYICKAPGGRGCVREVIELAMRSQGKWFTEEAHTW